MKNSTITSSRKRKIIKQQEEPEKTKSGRRESGTRNMGGAYLIISDGCEGRGRTKQATLSYLVLVCSDYKRR